MREGDGEEVMSSAAQGSIVGLQNRDAGLGPEATAEGSSRPPGGGAGSSGFGGWVLLVWACHRPGRFWDVSTVTLLPPEAPAVSRTSLIF